MTRFPDRRYFERVGRAAGFRPEPLETVFRLTDLLGAITAATGRELCLRGGTALNLGFLSLPRLSVDVDVDYVGSANTEDARRRRPELVRELGELARASGYIVAEERASYAMAHLRMRYTDAQGRAGTLKVDLNFLDRVPVLPPHARRLRHPFGDDLPPFKAQMLQFPELVASKLVALVRRGLARDLFDAALMAEEAAPTLEVVRTVLVVRGAGYPPPSPAEYSVDAVRRVSMSAWRSEVVALARRPLPVTLRKAQSDAVLLLGQAVELERGHRAFLDALDDGEIRPETLPLAGVEERVRANPALRWRLRVGTGALEER